VLILTTVWLLCDIRVSNSWNISTRKVCIEGARERKVFLKVEEHILFLPTGLLVTPRTLLCLFVHDSFVAAH
jgi:hypothetical protein